MAQEWCENVRLLQVVQSKQKDLHMISGCGITGAGEPLLRDEAAAVAGRLQAEAGE